MPLKFELCPDIEIAKKMIKMSKVIGMQSMETMRRVYQTVKKHNQNFCILQCTSAYPLEAEDVNLRVIAEYQKEFPDIPIGYSGHESGVHISVAAVAQGSKVIERHVTLDKSWKGSDHKASLEPSELTELVKLGKSVVAKVAIPKGTVLSMDMLGVKDLFQLVGKAVTEDVEEDESITPDVVESYGKKIKC
uniref:N-acetylneuraminic acid synthase a n=1 Tax=Hucho hucho TaxID=62062 RepID=A0A4W5QNI4_9TELE